MRLVLIAVFSACLVPPINAQQAPVPQPRQAEGEAPGVDPQLNLIVQGVVTAAGRLAVAAAVTGGNVPLPRPRPDVLAQDIVTADETAAAAAAAPEPEPQADLPPRVYQTACPAVLMGKVEAQPLPPLGDGSCGEQSPLNVTGVLVRGRMVPLSSPAVLNCEMATALPAWAEAVDGYLLARENTGLLSIASGTSYMCRNRNDGDTGDVSEHGFANALDVVGFTLEDGRSVAVETGWPQALAPEGRLLRFARDAACSLFTTTLGPEANALHFDHLHLDLGCHGETCAARLCE